MVWDELTAGFKQKGVGSCFSITLFINSLLGREAFYEQIKSMCRQKEELDEKIYTYYLLTFLIIIRLFNTVDY